MRRAVLLVAAACASWSPLPVHGLVHRRILPPAAELIAGLVIWSLVLALAVVGPAPLPRTLAGALVLGGLAALAVWSAVSILWAPLAGPAQESAQRLTVLQVGALLLGIGALRSPRAMRAVEPTLAGGGGGGDRLRTLRPPAAGHRGAVAVGAVGRPPGAADHLLERGGSAGRDGSGAVRPSSRATSTRPRGLRVAAAAVAPILGAGTYLTYSRGAIAVAVARPRRPRRPDADARAPACRRAGVGWRASAAAAGCSLLPAVASLEGAHATRDGAVALAMLALLARRARRCS